MHITIIVKKQLVKTKETKKERKTKNNSTDRD
jgi:hypothetical protein